ncbi:LysM peptidoglycan-binding domain-containing protein [Candidatus Saccharibacteria bacterium]|nr:LysM peptidoglycan-binding domain-containing protein [Candidatus Saccharibacteria bacterium]
MTKKKKIVSERLGKVLPYFLVGVVTLALVFFGSLDKKDQDSTLSLDTFASNDNNVSVDQMSELYVVADLSDALGLASAADVASNYVSANSIYNHGLTTFGKLEKPSVTDVNTSRGVIEYEVKEGENIDTIAAKFDATADQIRWSNGLKTVDVAVGTVLYIPSTSGIVYTVKSGDTAESIAAKYGSKADEIIAMNDLEVSGLSEGARIIIKGGTLPETERPEYVAPSRRSYRTGTSYTYTYLGDSSTRTNLSCNPGLGGGQCTTWGWLKRPDLGFIKANANRWDDIARAAGLTVNHTPAAGAIFQTDAGWYGHVGYVESVNSDGSINISERNYAGCRHGVLFSTVPAGAAGRFNYIH